MSDCSTGSSTFLLDAESQSFSPAESPVSSNSPGLDTNEDEKLEEVDNAPTKAEEKNADLPAIPENPPKGKHCMTPMLHVYRDGLEVFICHRDSFTNLNFSLANYHPIHSPLFTVSINHFV